ncbi:MAG: hypothetical protein JSS95_15355 [Acidobacteria bacterium]|nr:hypothetical protein [Acidobacteriota bacterium]
MRKLLLLPAILTGFTVGIHAQDTGAAAKPPAAATTAAAPAQPIAFNHMQHMQTAKMSCNDCHEPRGDGSTLAMPQAAKCMKCHASVATDNPDVKRLAEAAKNEDPIQWVRVYRVPSFVTFSHKTHTSAGSACEDCHGPVAERTAIAVEKEVNMANCIGCHQAKGAKATCDTCHAIMSKNGHSPFDIDATVLARLQIPAAKPTTIVEELHSGARITPQLATLAAFLHAPTL